MRSNPFAEVKGEQVALACEMMGMRPKELLNLPELERKFAFECAMQLESARWDRWAKLFGG